MTDFALTRTLDPADYDVLADAVTLIRNCRAGAALLAEQHPHRVWEYALTLEALDRWWRSWPPPRPHVHWIDVGGAGSPLMPVLLEEDVIDVVSVVDPKLNEGIEASQRPPVDVVSAISVIEHVAAPVPFLKACLRHLKPGGLFILTLDYQPENGKDTKHFHWDRTWIGTPGSWAMLTEALADLGAVPFGGIDRTYHGAHVYDYTFASVVAVKTESP